MDRIEETRTTPGWFMAAAIASLLFMALGCVMFLLHVTTDPNSLPIEQRTALFAEPSWVKIANGIAVIAGLVGAVLLVVKRRMAEALLLVSLVATIAWLLGLIVVRDLRENMSATDLLFAIIVTALVWTIFWFARRSRRRGWLR